MKKICFKEMSVIFKEDIEFLPRLECIPKILQINSGNDYKMKILSDKYSQTMKTLLLSLEDLTAEEVKTCVECICRFKNLRKLKLIFLWPQITQPLDVWLSLISQKCSKLLKLYIFMDHSIPISDHFFDVFHHFKTIRRLSVMLGQHTVVLSGSVQCFKHCTELYELSIAYHEMPEDFFKNVESFVPKLQFLQIYNKIEFSDAFIDSFRSMKFLKNFNHSVFDMNTERHQTKCWYFGKSLSEVMSSPNGKDVIRVNDNCGFVSTDQQFHDISD